MEGKDQIMAQLEDEFDRWENLLAGLHEQDIIARQLPSDLSIKDVMAHLWAWQQLSIARLEASIIDTVPYYPLDPAGLDPDQEENLERINAAIHSANLDRSWANVYKDWREGYERFMQLAEAIPAEDLMEAGKYAWLGDRPLMAVVEGSYDHHHEEHYGPLVQWLRENGQLG
jgi:hypothetical protein